jgi:serine/threonine protein kinase
MFTGTTQLGTCIRVPTTLGQYVIDRQVGEGTTCVVARARCASSNRVVALKIMNLRECAERKITGSLKREIGAMARVSHPNIAAFYETFQLDGHLVIAMEYCPDSLLACVMRGRLPSAVSCIIAQIAGAVEYLHDLGIAHGDIKLDNVLMDARGTPKLTDFGYCKIESVVGADQKGGTLIYAAPEMLRPGCYEPQVADVWSLGILIFAVCTGTFPWCAGSELELRRQILAGELLYGNLKDHRVRKLVAAMTTICPHKRIAIHEVLADPLLRDAKRPRRSSEGADEKRTPKKAALESLCKF